MAVRPCGKLVVEVVEMNILICDDLPSEAEALDDLLRSSGFQINIDVFHNPLDAMDFIRTGAVTDCCFLDIIMPEMNGIQLAATLRNHGYSGKIVFLSTSKDYGPESYTVDAFSYMLKPLTAEGVNEILNKREQTQAKADRAEILIQTAG
jgi:DNA-binding LytR/AlgR family response regulator